MIRIPIKQRVFVRGSFHSFTSRSHHRNFQDIDKPLAPAEGEGVLLKNPIDVALSSLLGEMGM